MILGQDEKLEVAMKTKTKELKADPSSSFSPLRRNGRRRASGRYTA